MGLKRVQNMESWNRLKNSAWPSLNFCSTGRHRLTSRRFNQIDNEWLATIPAYPDLIAIRLGHVYRRSWTCNSNFFQVREHVTSWKRNWFVGYTNLAFINATTELKPYLRLGFWIRLTPDFEYRCGVVTCDAGDMPRFNSPPRRKTT